MTPSEADREIERKKMENAVQWREEDLALRLKCHNDMMEMLNVIARALTLIAGKK